MSPKETDLKRLINKAAQFSEMRATANHVTHVTVYEVNDHDDFMIKKKTNENAG